MAAALAGLDDLEVLLQRSLDDDETARAGRLLEMVSDAVRRETRQLLSYVASDPVTVYASRGEAWLPERPIVSVASVTVSSVVLDPLSYVFRNDGWLGPAVFPFGPDGWTGPLTGDPVPVPRVFLRDGPINVVYTHGFQDVPGDLAGLVCEVAARHMTNPQQILMERVGHYQVQYAPTGGIKLTAADKAALKDYRRTAWAPKVPTAI